MPSTNKNLNLENSNSSKFKFRSLLWLLPLLFALLLFYLAIKPAAVNLSGQFLDNSGKAIVDSKYDFRVIAVDQNGANAKILGSWDYKSIDIKNGKFNVAVNPNILSLPTNSYFELCYLPNSANLQNSTNTNIPACNLTSNDSTNNYKYVACSRKLVQQGLVFNIQNLIGISSNNLNYSSNNLGCTTISNTSNVATLGNLDLINNFPLANFLNAEQKQEILDQRTQFVENIVQSYLQNHSITNSNSTTSGSDSDKQKLSLSGTQLSIENGNSIDLATLLTNLATTNNYYTNGSDNQKLAINGQTLTITNGNSITLPAAPGQVAQVLSYNSGILSLSNGGGSVTLPADSDSQQLSISGSVITLTNGGSITLPAPAVDLYVTGAVLSNSSTTSGSTSRILTMTRSGGLPDLTITIPDNDTLFTSGSGLTLTSNVFAIKPCADSQILKYNSTTSDWTCSADNDTTYTAGDGIVLNSNTFSLKVCNASELLIFNGTNWVCVPDSKYTYIAGTGIDVTNNQISNTGTLSVTGSGVIGVTSGQNPVVSLNPCADGQFLYYNSSAWACLDFSSLDKYHDNISTTDSGTGIITHNISLTGPNSTPSLSTNIIDADSQHLTYDSATRTITITGTNGNSTVNSITLPADKYLASATISTSPITSGSTNRDLTLTMADGTIYTVTIPDNDTLYQAGNGVILSGTTFAVNSPTCNANQRLSWSGNAFTCEYTNFTITDGTTSQTVNPNSTITYSATGPLKAQVTATNTVTYSLLPCSNANQILRYNTISNSWVCDLVSLNAGNSDALTVSGSGTTASPFIVDLRTDCTNDQVLEFNTATSKWECKNNPDLYHTAIANLNTQATTGTGVITNKIDITSSNGAPLLSTTLEDFDNQVLSYNSSTRVVSLSGPNGVGVISNVNLPDDIYLSSATISTSPITSGTTNRTLTLTLTDGTNFPIVIPDNDTLYSAGVGLIKTSANQFYVDAPNCGANQRLSWNGVAFSCVSYLAGNGITISGDTISNAGLLSLSSEDGIVFVNNSDPQNPKVSLAPCSEGEVYKFTGGVWKCMLEYSYNFSITDGTNTEQVDNGNFVTYKADRGLEVEVSATDIVTYRLPKCDVGYMMQFDGSVWTCAKDNLQYYDESTVTPNNQPAANGSNSVAIGDGAQANGTFSMVLGANSIDNGNQYNAILGYKSMISSGQSNIITGNGSQINANDSNIITGNNNNIATDTNNPIDTNENIINGNSNKITNGNTNFVAGNSNNINDANYSNFIGYLNQYTGGNMKLVNIMGFNNKGESSDFGSIVGNENTYKDISNFGILGNSNKIVTDKNTYPNNFDYGILGNNNIIDVGTSQAFILGSSITNSISGSVQLGTNDKEKTIIYNDGSLEFRGALMPAGNPGSSGQVLISQGAGIEPVWANVGSLLTAGSGVTISGSTISVNAPSIKCASNERITWDPAGGGQFTCVKTNFTITDGTNSQTIDPTDTISYKVGSTGALTTVVSATDTVTYDLRKCTSDGQVLKWNATTSMWDCRSDNDTLYTAGSGLTLTSNQFSINAPTCATGNVLTWDGNAFSCVANKDWTTTGNAGTTPTTNFVGTTDANDLAIRTNNVEKMRIFSLANPSVGIGVNSLSGVTGGASSYSGPTIFMGSAANISGPTGIDIIIDNNDDANNNLFRVKANADGGASELVLLTVSESGDLSFTGALKVGASGNAGTSGQILISQGSGNAPIWTSAIGFNNLPTTGCTNGQVLKYNGTAWSCQADAGLTSEVDGIIGNEVLDLTIGTTGTTTTGGTTALVRSGSVASGYGLDLKACANQQILKYNTTANTWDCALDNNSGGTITSITAGTGLTGGTITSTGTIALNGLTSTACASGERLSWNGTSFICSSLPAEVDGVIGNEVFDITAGTGITITGTKAAGYTVASILGTSIETGEITDGTISIADLSSMGCTNGQILKYNGTTWSCGNDLTNTTSLVAGTTGATTTGGTTALNISGSAAAGYGVDLKACAKNQILKFSATNTWECSDLLPKITLITSKALAVTLPNSSNFFSYDSNPLYPDYNNLTGQYVVPNLSDGYYEISASLRVDFPTGGTFPKTACMEIVGPGSTNVLVSDCQSANVASSTGLSVHSIVYLTTGQTVQINAYRASSSAFNTLAGQNHLTITRLQ